MMETMESTKEAFYVQQGCCIRCGAPQEIAPTLIGWRANEELTECYWIRQPQTPDELEQAIKIIHTQDLGCHRYAGTNPKIIRRLPSDQCDFPSLGLFHSIWRLAYGWYRIFRDSH
jgi:hypothetical protein